jgi:hypothetical protein
MDYPGDTQTRAVVFNTLKYGVELSIFTYPVPTSEKTLLLDYKGQQPVYHTTLKISCDISLHCINQMLCGNITAACSENDMKPTKTVSVSTIMRFLTLTEAVSTVTTVVWRFNPLLSVTYELHF